MRTRDPRLTVIRAVITGTLTAAAVVVLREIGLIGGPVAIAVAGVLVLAAPTSRQLSRRILLTGTLLFGWVPVLWWVPLPVGSLGRVTILLAAGAGALAAWVSSSGRPVERLRGLVPRLVLVDALPLVAAGASAIFLRGWWQLRTGEETLAILSRGWDNSAHFNMVEMIRAHNATIDTLAAPGSTTWKFADYPQSFHAAMAAIMELTGSVAPANAGAELVGYVHSLGLVAVLGVSILVAGLCALPSLRRRPLLAAPLAVLTTAAYLIGPGSVALFDGFPNFYLGCVLVSAALLIAAPLRRRVPLLHLAALGGTFIAVTHSWVLLVGLVAPVAVLAIVILARHRTGSRRTTVVAIGVVVVTVVGMARAAQILLGLQATQVLTTQGGIAAPNLAGVLVPAVLVCLGWAVLGTVPLRVVPRTARSTARWIALVPAIGLATSAAIGLVQLRTDGALSYYFWKFAIGLQLVTAVALVVGIATAVPPRTAPGRRFAIVPVFASLAACLVATQAFGLFGPGFSRIGIAPVAPGAPRYLQVTQDSPATVATARHLLEAAARQRADPGTPLVFLETGPQTINPVSAQQWLLALTSRWTAASNAQATLLTRADDTTHELASSAERVLQSDPDAHLVLAGDTATTLAGRLSDAGRVAELRTP